MGIMSKNNRLPERPKPPSWDFISEDVQAAENHDVVFVVGKDNLNETAASQRSSSERNVNTSSSSFNSSGTIDSDLDASNLDPAQVEASHNNVLRLISLYTELKDAPENMQREFSQLKEKGAEITESILELKTLAAQTISTQSRSQTSDSKASAKKSPGTDGSSSSKGKSKQKKKK